MMGKHRKERHIGGSKPTSAIPRWLRPKLNKQSITDLGLAHWQNLDALATGQGTPEIMWQIGGGILTWSRVADLIKRGAPEMAEQVDLLDRVIQHWRATGRAEWPTPTDYELARTGAEVMDALAEIVDAHTALQAAVWSENKINAMADANSIAEVAHA